MQTKQILKAGLAAAAAASFITACGPAPTETQPSASPSADASADPSAEPSADASAEPSAEPTAEPSAEPSAEPTAEPTAAPTAEPTAEPTAAPTAEATATPLPSATSDISVVETTTFNGKVFDDTQAPLDGVTITAKSLNSSVPFDATTTTASGTYAFNNAPSGVQIEIVASRPGYTTRRRVEVLKSNKDGDPNANKYDFGTDGTAGITGNANNALSDKPEVVTVTPGRNASGVDPKTSFVLKFSEPMDRQTVEDNFVVRSFTQETLTVDDELTVAAKGGALTDDQPTTGTKIWDEDAFTVSWNSDDTEVTFTFSDERQLPTDEESANTPEYYITFTNDDKQLKDKAGITRDGDYFKLTDGNFEGAAKFGIQTDTKDPTVRRITAQTDENSGTDGDSVRVEFSERMIHYTEERNIAGGIDNISTKAPGAVTDSQTAADTVSGMQAAANYEVDIFRGTTRILGKIKWNWLGGTAVYDTNDVTHKTVKLLPGMNSGNLTAAGAVANTETLTGTVYYKDGSSAATTGTVTGTDLNNVRAGFNSLTNINGDPITVNAVNDPAAAVAAGDVFTYTMAAGATKSGLTTLADAIAFVKIDGGSALSDLIGAGNSIYLYPGASVGARADLYDPGDNVKVFVATTVLDPAGNSVDSSNNDASANAS